MKTLSLILIAALMIGCSGAEDEDGVGDGASQASDKVPFEVEKRDDRTRAGFVSVFITSLENDLRISNAMVNRGNCRVHWSNEDDVYFFKFDTDKDKSIVKVSNNGRDVETISLKDFYVKYGADKALKIDFGNTEQFFAFCDPIEIQIDTNKGSWTYSFR